MIFHGDEVERLVRNSTAQTSERLPTDITKRRAPKSASLLSDVPNPFQEDEEQQFMDSPMSEVSHPFWEDGEKHFMDSPSSESTNPFQEDEEKQFMDSFFPQMT